MIICFCSNVTDKDVLLLVEDGHPTDFIIDNLAIGRKCDSCLVFAKKTIAELIKEKDAKEENNG